MSIAAILKVAPTHSAEPVEMVAPKATRGKTAKVINKKRSVGAERQMLFSRCSSEAPPSDRY